MTSTRSFATTLSPTKETLSSSQLLSSSISSLNSSRQSSSQISKIYRQSSTLFLTRRLPESLSTILPVITPQEADEENQAEAAPVSRAGKTTRIKVWSLYLTILNAVVELDPDEGKQAFGSSDFRSLVSKVREGEVWEEVVQNGYGGVEGDVDSDVVINLATLLLAHAKTQKTNQARLETYLAASTNPTLDISNRLQAPRSRSRGPSPSKGTDTPRDLNARVKILELYTLHVLLRNNEWDYAREFISVSSVLDEERREAFLQALQSLQDEQKEHELREREEQRYQDEQLKRDIEDAKRKRLEHEERERLEKERRNRDRGGGEVDYGVEETSPPTPRPGSSKSRSSANGRPITKKSNLSPTARSAVPAKKAPPTLVTRAGNIISNMRKVLEDMAVNFQTRPLFLLQMLAFVIGLVAVLSRKDVKDRLKKIVYSGWMKVRSTAGMGVKVSYI